MSTKVGIVGCGNISEIYLKNSRRLADIEVVAVSDIDRQRAQARADEFQIPKVLSIPELLADEASPIPMGLGGLCVCGGMTRANRAKCRSPASLGELARSRRG